MAIALVPILMIIIGILVYELSSRADVKEIGRACFWAGFIAIGLAYATHMVHIG